MGKNEKKWVKGRAILGHESASYKENSKSSVNRSFVERSRT